MPAPQKFQYAIGLFVLDVANQRLTRDGEPVQLSVKAIGLLACLVTRAGRLVTREELLAEVWPGETVDDNNISVHIGALRRVLGTDPEYIETVPRRGYRFIGPVSASGISQAAAPEPVGLVTRPRKIGLLAASAAATVMIGLGAMAYWAAGNEVAPPPPPVLTLADSPPGARCCNAAVTLPNGLVLVAGGAGEGIRAVGQQVGTQLVTRHETVEYDPLSFRMQIVRPLRFEREFPSATLLADGRVLVAGGWGCDGDREVVVRPRTRLTYCLASKRRPLDSAELYDPATKSFTPVEARMQVPRGGHTATLLTDGTVLIVGGHTGTADWGTHVELFDPTQPSAQAFRRLDALSTTILNASADLDCRECRGGVRKADHTATLLQDGTVLIAGGWRGTADAQVFDGALRYRAGDTGLTLAHPTGLPYVRAAGATATLVSDGRIVFAGGHRDHRVSGSPEVPLATTLIYDPRTVDTVPGPSLGETRVGHAATLIHDDTIVIAGGMSCPFTYSDAITQGPHHPSRPACDASASADVFTLRPTPHVRTTTAMTRGRAYFSASWLRDGGDRVLFMGGLTSPGVATSVAEVADFSAWITQGR